jgi:hypothetical protein
MFPQYKLFPCTASLPLKMWIKTCIIARIFDTIEHAFPSLTVLDPQPFHIDWKTIESSSFEEFDPVPPHHINWNTIESSKCDFESSKYFNSNPLSMNSYLNSMKKE